MTTAPACLPACPRPWCRRIEHPQELINQLQYGEGDAAQVQRGKGAYPVAEYRLAAEISAAQAAQAAAAAAQAAGAASGGGKAGWLPDDWYQPLLAGQPGGAAGAGEGGGGGSSKGVAAEARGVYSFCMCPGGQIVPTSTCEEELCINGMSFSR